MRHKHKVAVLRLVLVLALLIGSAASSLSGTLTANSMAAPSRSGLLKITAQGE